jgi:hypothetical protein
MTQVAQHQQQPHISWVFAAPAGSVGNASEDSLDGLHASSSYEQPVNIPACVQQDLVGANKMVYALTHTARVLRSKRWPVKLCSSSVQHQVHLHKCQPLMW